MSKSSLAPSRHRLCLAIGSLLLIGTVGIASASSNSGGTAAHEPDPATVMPPIANPPVALQVRSASAIPKGWVYSDAAFPSITPEFQQFRANTQKITFDQLNKAGGKISRAEFERMTKYIDNAYSGLTVVKTIQMDGQIFDCIPAAQQPALRGGSAVDTPPGDDDIPGISDAEESSAGLSEACGGGTVPFARLDIRDMAKYPSLQSFLKKGVRAKPVMASAKAADVQAPKVGDHQYVVVRTNPTHVNGGGADLNVWKPPVDPAMDNYRMSLMQIWVSGDNSKHETQTLEVGWQVQPLAWKTPKPTPFIYSTQDGYNKTGCYNLECKDFVQTSPKVVFGSAFANDEYSKTGGAQRVIKVAWHRKNKTGNWWLKVNGDWIGYYPASLYEGDLAKESSALTFDAGGEIAAPDGGPSLPMGSGKFADLGYKEAAYITAMRYLNKNEKTADVDLDKAQLILTYPKCYTLALAGMLGDEFANGLPAGVSTIGRKRVFHGPSFYLGGPGSTNKACKASIVN